MKNILIISDASIVIKSIMAECENYGDKVTHVENGSKALELLFNEKYDLILTSVFLEGLDGVQLTTTLKRSNTINSTSTIVLLTSGGDMGELFTEETKPDLIIQKDQHTIEKFKEFYNGLEVTNGQKLKLLYIDDDKFIQKIIKTWFSKVDEIELTLCGSIKELETHLETRFDIIVSDNLLDDGNIYDVLDVIRVTPLKEAPLIVYTGTVDKLKFDEITSLGNVIDILPKPFEMKAFMKMVKNLKIKP